MTTLPKVRLHLQQKFGLPQRRKLKSFIIELFNQEGKPLQQIDYIFISDEALLKMNQQYLGHDFYTDIVTFDLSSDERVVGEVYISIDRIMENADNYGA